MHTRPLVTTVAILGTLALRITAANAQDTGNGTYHATPSWDQTLPATTRFVVLANFNSQAVLDRETGLVWQRSPDAPADAASSFGQYSSRCLEKTTGNRRGWRLPTINELESLFDPSATAAPWLPAGHPFTGFPETVAEFLSSTVYMGFELRPSGAHRAVTYGSPYTNFSVSIGILDFNTPPSWTLCVRGGLNADPQ